jgi:ribosomal protein L24E
MKNSTCKFCSRKVHILNGVVFLSNEGAFKYYLENYERIIANDDQA